MLKIIVTLLASVFAYACIMAQSYSIEQYRLTDNKIKRIENGDKVLISFKQLSADVINRPERVFIGDKDTGTTTLFVKARIIQITDSSIQFKDRSLSGKREIRLSEITGIRKLTFGKQVGRTVVVGLGYAAVGLAIAELNGGTIWEFMSYLVAGAGLVSLGSDHFSKKYIDNWKIRVVQTK